MPRKLKACRKQLLCEKCDEGQYTLVGGNISCISCPKDFMVAERNDKLLLMCKRHVSDSDESQECKESLGNIQQT